MCVNRLGIYLVVLFHLTVCGKTNLVSQSVSRASVALRQLSLENEGFSCAVIDGKMGPRTEKALRCQKLTGVALSTNSATFVEWIVPVHFDQELQSIPESWLARSKLSAMPYSSLREKLAEKFHVSESFLEYLNPQIKNWNNLSTGTSIKVPQLILRPLPKADALQIFLNDKVIVAWDAQKKLIASFPCSIAAKKEKRPSGKLEVKVLAPNPDYCFDPVVFPENPESASIKSKLMISPGPNNPVGEMWIGLNLPGYGIHGTPFPEDIGKTASHGCFRLTNWDAKRLGSILKLGTPVTISESLAELEKSETGN